MNARCCSVTISPSLETLRALLRSGVRSINGLLLTHSKSFQSSTKVLDPAANPTLFQSTLAIIIKVRIFGPPLSRSSLLLIKDVIDSDTKEIVNE